MTELVNFIFHLMKIFNLRHKLAFKQVVRFKVLQYIKKCEHVLFIYVEANETACTCVYYEAL